MDFNVNYEDLEEYVRKFKDDYDLFYWIKDTIDYLYHNNKNYNQQQWVKIQDLKEVFDNICIIEK